MHELEVSGKKEGIINSTAQRKSSSELVREGEEDLAVEQGEVKNPVHIASELDKVIEE